MLQLIESPFDYISLLVEMLIIGNLRLPVRSRRNDRLGSLRDDRLSRFIAVVALIGNDVFCGNSFDQTFAASGIMNFAAGEFDSNGISERVNRKVNFGAEATFGSSQSLIDLPPFALAAER